MAQTASLAATVPMARFAIGSKDVSAREDGRACSVREKVKQGNTVIRGAPPAWAGFIGVILSTVS